VAECCLLNDIAPGVHAKLRYGSAEQGRNHVFWVDSQFIQIIDSHEIRRGEVSVSRSLVRSAISNRLDRIHALARGA
jgi:hypothetical protein